MTWIRIRDQQETRGAQGGLRPADTGDGMGTASGTHQKGAEEDEGDKVEVGEVAPTLSSIGERVAGPAAEAGQHDLVPGLPSGAPEKRAEHEAQEGRPRTGPGREPGNSGELGSFPQGSCTCVRSGYQTLLLKKKPLALAFQADHDWESTSYGKESTAPEVSTMASSPLWAPISSPAAAQSSWIQDTGTPPFPLLRPNTRASPSPPLSPCPDHQLIGLQTSQTRATAPRAAAAAS